MNTDQLKDQAAETTDRMQENVSNLPLLSIALAGLLGAGVVSLLSTCLCSRDDKSGSQHKCC